MNTKIVKAAALCILLSAAVSITVFDAAVKRAETDDYEKQNEAIINAEHTCEELESRCDELEKLKENFFQSSSEKEKELDLTLQKKETLSDSLKDMYTFYDELSSQLNSDRKEFDKLVAKKNDIQKKIELLEGSKDDKI